MTDAAPLQTFISYSHADEAIRKRLRTNLAPLVRNGLLRLWDDWEIPVGEDWREVLEARIDGADGVIFLVSPGFLASGFCMDEEVPAFLKRHRDDGVLLLFVLVEDGLWEDVEFITRIQMLPRGARPIREHKPQSKAYTAVAREIRDRVNGHRSHKPARPEPESEHGPGPAALSPRADLSTLLDRLPGRTDRLIGRDDELKQLSDWLARSGVFLWVAPGGMGKSALTRWWLAQHDWPAGTRFLGHSFYSQGSHIQATSARGFLAAALKGWGVAYPDNADDIELGRLLAEEAARRPTVLLLDGLEPLQQTAPGDAGLHGTIRDRGLAALLEGLARVPGQAVCVASSRLPIPDAASMRPRITESGPSWPCPRPVRWSCSSGGGSRVRRPISAGWPNAAAGIPWPWCWPRSSVTAS